MNKSKVLSWISRWCRPIGSYSIWYNDIIIHMAQLIGYFRINSQLTCCSTFKYSASACFVTSGFFFLMHWFAIRWPDWPTQIQHVELAEKSRWGPTSADGVEHTEKISRSTNKNCPTPDRRLGVYRAICAAAVFPTCSQKHVCGCIGSNKLCTLPY